MNNYFESFSCQIHSDESPLCDLYDDIYACEDTGCLDSDEQGPLEQKAEQ